MHRELRIFLFLVAACLYLGELTREDDIKSGEVLGVAQQHVDLLIIIRSRKGSEKSALVMSCLFHKEAKEDSHMPSYDNVGIAR